MKTKLAIVTGANQGLGFSLVKMLCQNMEAGTDVFLTARNKDRGEQAVHELKSLGLSPKFYELDISKQDDIENFAEFIKNEYGGVDLFIHNAATRQNPDENQSAVVKEFITTNAIGTIDVLKGFVPLLNNNAHFLVVASSFGSLKYLPQHLHQYFDSDILTLEQLKGSLNDYIKYVEEGSHIEQGYPEWINITSKIGRVAALRIVARENKNKFKKRNILMNSICPGLLDTAASRPWFVNMNQALDPDEATEDIWWAIRLKWNEGTYGQMYQFRKIIPWKIED